MTTQRNGLVLMLLALAACERGSAPTTAAPDAAAAKVAATHLPTAPDGAVDDPTSCKPLDDLVEDASQDASR
jgi:hypothetical protein